MQFTRANLINAALFQIAWLACVVGGAQQLFWPGVIAVFALILSVANTLWARHDVLLALLLMPLGWLLDSGWVAAGILDFDGRAVAPAWIVLLWLAVALTINHSLGFFCKRPALGAVVVLFAAPLTYLAGERLGAVVVLEPKKLVIISISWSLLFYLVFRYARTGLPTWPQPAGG